MAYQCPRCGDPASRNYSTTAQLAGRLVGALFVGAFGAFGCKKCGKIPRAIPSRCAKPNDVRLVGHGRRRNRAVRGSDRCAGGLEL